MIDHDNEDLIPFARAGQAIPGKPSRCTLFRWALRGVRGARLETLLIGGVRYTSRQAISRFVARQNAPETPDNPGFTAGQRAKQSEAARRELEKMGI